MPKHLLAFAALIGCSTLVGQSTATLPPAFETLPGNAGVAMPLRWSKGKLQVFIDPVMMPTGFVGETITGLRLRRSTLEGAHAEDPRRLPDVRCRAGQRDRDTERDAPVALATTAVRAGADQCGRDPGAYDYHHRR